MINSRKRLDYIVVDDVDQLSPKEKELLSWLQEHPDADPEAIKEVQRRLREIRLNNHLNSVKTGK